ncbi:MAG: flagellar hook-basal body complex protein FliE [Desulfobacula sp. RIFOXYA12_FULL_46_16]|nr:MAG: flagellar hook-basal body complex protein FliE [Deltaproteobacteria bacterium RIFOXYC2_FULL_48_10]OGR20715.1 MAG: flagellar hook-basal body complex protein FliE [Desulfobacula sp. RIFOXYA12_FULL_46_16]OGR58957.1 MAG: flagellar hook-basal body complex protein FliE [Desulfobacula sp. RIFOXYB2_FULL_45_6]
MMNGIKGINRISLKTEPLPEKISRRNPEFAERIKSAVLDVNEKQQIADDSIEKVIKGEMEIHEGMMDIGKAETSLKILAQVRNKVMAAYNEIMRMQI